MPTISTSGPNLGGAFIPNADNLEHAFARIEMFEEGTCLCAAYPLRSTYDPEREQARGHYTWWQWVARQED